MRALSILLVAMTVLAPAAPAQKSGAAPDSSVPIGGTVRVLQGEGRYQREVRGTLMRLSSDSAVLRLTDGQGWPRDTVVVLGQGRVLEMRTSRRSGWHTGLGIGSLIGAVAGGVIGARSYEPCVPDNTLFSCMMADGPGYYTAGGAALGALAGGALGAIVGSAVVRESWSPLRPGAAPARLTITPAGEGMAVGVRFSF